MEDPAEVVAPKPADVVVAEAFAEEQLGDFHHTCHIVKTGHSTVAVEIAANAHMVDSAYIDEMAQMNHEGEDKLYFRLSS